MISRELVLEQTAHGIRYYSFVTSGETENPHLSTIELSPDEWRRQVEYREANPTCMD